MFAVADAVDAGLLRRAISRYCDRLCPGAPRVAQAQLVATELATNLVRHAKPGGWILARPVAPTSVEILAVDRGPGIADPRAAVEGRVPNPGGLGRGLAAVRRASAHFDLHTEVGAGTTVLSVVDLVDPPGELSTRSCAGVSVGLGASCGDGWAVAEADRGLAVVVVDGLGHGPKASVAADAAVAAFASAPADVERFVERANAALRTTRGAAVAVCHLRPDLGELRFVGVGNVNGRVLWGSEQRGLAPPSGTLGLRVTVPRARTITQPWEPGAVLILWTDGLASRLDLAAGAPLLAHDPAVVAATLHRDHTRQRDDATVVVVRNGDPQ